MQLVDMPRYESYKDSGADWADELPSEWPVEKAKWLFTRAERAVQPDDGIVTCFRDGEVTLRINRRTDGFTNALKEHGYQRIHAGDLVIHAMDAFAGAIGVSDSTGKSTPVYSACTERTPNTVNPYFYAYYLRSLALSGYLESLAKGIRERSTDFRFADFAKLVLAFPAIDTQNAIAAFLDQKTAKIDEAIAIKERQIALLKERKQIIIQNAVTQGLNPDAPMKDSGVEWIGQIPAHWEVKRLKYVVRVLKRIIGSEGPDVLSITQSGIKIKDIESGEGQLASDYSGYQIVNAGDFAMNHMDLVTGYVDISKYDGVTSPDYRVFENTSDQVDDEYLLRLFQHGYKSRIFFKYGRGVHSEGRWRFPKDSFDNFFIPVPPIEEQRLIAKSVTDQHAKIDKALDLKIAQIVVLKEYKATLINSAVTGKIKVV